MAIKKRLFGKYRGVVIDNLDPQQIGRIIVQAPDALGDRPSGFATPCVPAAGLQAGVFVIPPIGSQVWVEFEQGDPDRPIWCGGFWGSPADVPVAATTPPPIAPGQNIVLQTALQASVVLSDAPQTSSSGGVILRSAGGATIVVNDAGIVISNGRGASITLTGPTVDINEGALTIVGA